MIKITTNNHVADNTIVINGTQFFVTDEVATQILNLCQGKATKVSNTATKPVAKKTSTKYEVKSDKPITWSLGPDGTVTFKFDNYVGRKVYRVAKDICLQYQAMATKDIIKTQKGRKAFVEMMNQKNPVIKAEAANAVKFVWERA